MKNSDKKPNELRQPVLNKANVSRRAGQIKPGSFADGIRMLNEKGALVVPVKLTKQRAVMLLDFIGEFKHDWYCLHEEGHHLEDDMQKTCQWLLNQINKRWSQNELHTPNKKRRRHGG